tara:strand:+ start:350 stop:664 length:315 start_codon:yes stop_codon:yes gene_type:complete
MTTEIKNWNEIIPEKIPSTLKGKPINMSREALQDRARRSAITRAKNRAKEFGIRGEPKKISLILDGNLVKDFDKARIIAHDPTLTAGIRRAMQDFIRYYRFYNC